MSQYRTYKLAANLVARINAQIPENQQSGNMASSAVVKVDGVQQDVEVTVEMQSGEFGDVADAAMTEAGFDLTSVS